MGFIILPFYIVFAVIFATALVSFTRRHHKQLEQKKSAWKELTVSTGLAFVPAGYFAGGSRVTGKYRGFTVRLETIAIEGANDKQELYTAIRLIDYNEKYLNSPTNSQVTIDDIAKQFRLQSPSLYWRHCRIELHQNDLRYLEPGVQLDLKKLKDAIDHLCELAKVLPHVTHLGGEAISFLQPAASDSRHPLKRLAKRLLVKIELDTEEKFEDDLANVCCRHCLTRFTRHKVKIEFLSSTRYYACRNCLKSRHYYNKEGLWIVLVLDNQMQEDVIQHDRFLYVNWLQRQNLFDFDEVRIVHATDEEASLLAVQVSNDTDPYRTERYDDVLCHITKPDMLSNNTHHILKQAFSNVQIKEI